MDGRIADMEGDRELNHERTRISFYSRKEVTERHQRRRTSGSLWNIHLDDVRGNAAVVAAARHRALNLEIDCENTGWRHLVILALMRFLSATTTGLYEKVEGDELPGVRQASVSRFLPKNRSLHAR